MDTNEAVRKLQQVYDAVLGGDLGMHEREDIYSRLNAVIDWLEKL